MKKKTIPLPCTEEQYKTVKRFCLEKGIKYVDLTDLLILSISKENENKCNNKV